MVLLREVNVSKMERVEGLLDRLREGQGLGQLDFEDFAREEFKNEEYCFGTSCITLKVENLALKYTYNKDNYTTPIEYDELKDYEFPKRPEYEILSKLNTKYFAEIYAYEADFILMNYIESSSVYNILSKCKNPESLFLLEKKIEHIFLDCLKRGVLPSNLISNDFLSDKEGNVKILGTTSFILFEDIEAICGTFPFEMTIEKLAQYCLKQIVYGFERDEYRDYLAKYGIDLDYEKSVFDKKVKFILENFSKQYS